MTDHPADSQARIHTAKMRGVRTEDKDACPAGAVRPTHEPTKGTLMSSVLVTGGAGFTGRHVVDELADAGHNVVSYNRDFLPAPRADVISAQGELADIPRLVYVLREHQVDTIVHTAAISHPTYSLSFPVATFAANVEGTVSVFEAARMASINRIVNFSSRTVYGANPFERIAEDQPVNPSTPYAVTKVATEWLGQVYTLRYGIDVISMRISQVYGPGNKMDEIIRAIMQGVIRDGRFHADRGGDHAYNLIYAADVARATRAAVEAAHPMGSEPRPLAYNISSTEYLTLTTILEVVRDCYPEADLFAGPGLDPTLDQQGRLDTKRAATDLAFVARWPIAHAIPDYGDWLRTHSD